MYAERLLPHDLDAEESVIGSLLIDGDSILRVGHVVKPEDFYREKNQICFSSRHHEAAPGQRHPIGEHIVTVRLPVLILEAAIGEVSRRDLIVKTCPEES